MVAVATIALMASIGDVSDVMWPNYRAEQFKGRLNFDQFYFNQNQRGLDWMGYEAKVFLHNNRSPYIGLGITMICLQVSRKIASASH